MKRYMFLGLLAIGSLSACTPERHTEVVVDRTPPPVVDRVDHHTVVEQPVVAFSPSRDVMTQVDVRAKETAATSRAVENTAPDVVLGSGDYHQKRYSPSIFK